MVKSIRAAVEDALQPLVGMQENKIAADSVGRGDGCVFSK